MRLMSWKRTAVSLTAAVMFTLAAGSLAGCHNSDTKAATSPSSLPAAADLISQASTAMGNVQTVHFTIKVDGNLSGLPVKSADGVLTKAGEAKGSATISELGATIQAEFVIVDNSFYLKALTGGYQKLPLASAASIYDPSAILDPNRGIPKLLATAQNAKTVGVDTVEGKPAYKVTITPDQTAVQSLIPGASAGTTGTIWIDESTKKVVKGVFGVPSGGKTVNVTVTLDNYDAPVSISAP
jgi:lipoprotein LprG